MDSAIEEFVQRKEIAVVGVSRSGRKFGNSACRELRARGYTVFPVHPEAQEIDGMRCVPDLASLRGTVGSVLVSVPAAKVPGVLRAAAAIGVTNVWIQQGAASREASLLAEELRLHVVSGKCILMYAPPVRSMHAWHRALLKYTGRL